MIAEIVYKEDNNATSLMETSNHDKGENMSDESKKIGEESVAVTHKRHNSSYNDVLSALQQTQEFESITKPTQNNKNMTPKLRSNSNSHTTRRSLTKTQNTKKNVLESLKLSSKNQKSKGKNESGENESHVIVSERAFRKKFKYFKNQRTEITEYMSQTLNMNKNDFEIQPSDTHIFKDGTFGILVNLQIVARKNTQSKLCRVFLYFVLPLLL